MKVDLKDEVVVKQVQVGVQVEEVKVDLQDEVVLEQVQVGVQVRR